MEIEKAALEWPDPMCDQEREPSHVHSKAMPVILTGNAWDQWLGADAAEALKLQQPWPADRLVVVATGQRQDAAA